MRAEVFTIFPELVSTWAGASLIGKAWRSGAIEIVVHDLRTGANDPRRSVDDSPFGGGAGMVLAPEPLFAAVEAAQPVRPLYLLGPGGLRFDQAMARELAAGPGFSLLCGRYEGVDERVAEHLVDGELSIGDFVLAGGEAAAAVVVEAVARLVPGVMGNVASTDEESFTEGLLEYPQYTRPAEFRGWPVPEVLLSGHHSRVAEWRKASALARTLERRPDLIAARGGISPEEEALLARWGFDAQSLLVMVPTDLIDRENLRDDVPDFSPGDTVRVHVRVVEGNRERVQAFQGAVIARKGSGVRETFTVRKVSSGVGVERTWPVHSPSIARVEVVTLGDVRRAKLYYLRDRIGKAAKIKEKRLAH